MLANILLYVYIVAAIGWFFLRIGNAAFVRATLTYFLIITLAICLIEFGSVYSIYWDFARWHGGETWTLFPITISPSQSGANPISKTTFTYWLLSISSTAFYISFPQAVIRASSIHLANNKLSLAVLRFLSYGYGIGEAFIGIMLTLSSLVSFMPDKNMWVMLVGCAILIIAAWGGIRADLKRGFSHFVPGGKAAVTAVEMMGTVAKKMNEN